MIWSMNHSKWPNFDRPARLPPPSDTDAGGELRGTHIQASFTCGKGLAPKAGNRRRAMPLGVGGTDLGTSPPFCRCTSVAPRGMNY
jgi:hypothetical protein